MLDYLFVYGTLRKALDGSLHPYLNHAAEFIGNAGLPGKLYHIRDYPGAVLLAANSRPIVQGELYQLLRPRLLLQQLDDYEECGDHFPTPHEYQRRRVTVTLSDDTQAQAWAYIYQHSTLDLQEIHNGNYRRFLPKTHQNL
ncbi:gamma-glutamylcyclotransferase family protein [Methylomonas methanica]|uniref:AIG2 family protein n=1 Tax=Methylomonas methanica (strain DSM 25384 / MC09) TaxID=857087 RepID=G0A067_METMM|nr:gamma-glutamylcyclotransferase family protein [Methylomonas methanica]AEG01206.1 AIG2 family protein [Methylomonas methanica MC09]